MQTNEQTKNLAEINTAKEDEAKEALILKGIATSINAMQFPKMKHLNEMLNNFGYKLIEIDNTEKNSVISFYKKHEIFYKNEINSRYEHMKYVNNLNYTDNITTFDYNNLESLEENNLVFTGLMKKLILCSNIISFYEKENDISDVIDFNINDNKYMKIINILTKDISISSSHLPLYFYKNKTYVFSYKEFNSLDDLFNFLKLRNLLTPLIVNSFLIKNDDKILLNYVKI